jgi:hypothetical protein
MLQLHDVMENLMIYSPTLNRTYINRDRVMTIHYATLFSTVQLTLG